MKNLVLLALGSAAASLASVSVASAASVIDFQVLEVNNNSATNIGAFYIEDGFILNSSRLNFAAFGTQEPRYPGSTALFDRTIDSITTLTKAGGGSFSLISIDLDYLNGAVIPGLPPTVVNFVGKKADLSEISQGFTLDLNQGLQTFNFSGFDDLASVSWTEEYPYHQFDNIVVDGGTSAPIPEPTPALLPCLIAMGAAALLRTGKRKPSEQEA